MTRPPRLSPRTVIAALACAGAAGCGGGLYIGWEGEYGYDDPPGVALSVQPAQAAPGEPLRLIADARDDHAVLQVDFYQVDPAGRVQRLGGDAWPPYTWDLRMPDTAGQAVRFLARAHDDAGQVSDSAWIAVTPRR